MASQSLEQAKFYCLFVLFEKTCSGIPIPWFYRRPSINNAIEKPKKKVPRNLILKWTEHCLIEFRSDPSLAEFQQWLELQSQIYDKVNWENPMRNTFPNSKNFGSSSINPSTAYRNYTSQPLNSVVVNQDRNQSVNCNRVCSRCQPILPRRNSTQTDLAKNAKVITVSLSSFVLCPPSERYSIVSKNTLYTNCLSNKHHKQTCPSTKRSQVCSGFHHTTLHDTAKQIKCPTAAFSTETAQKHHPIVSSNNKTVVENSINNSPTKGLQNKNSNSRYGQSFNGQNQTNPQRRNLNESSTNQTLSINQSPDAPKN